MKKLNLLKRYIVSISSMVFIIGNVELTSFGMLGETNVTVDKTKNIGVSLETIKEIKQEEKEQFLLGESLEFKLEGNNEFKENGSYKAMDYNKETKEYEIRNAGQLYWFASCVNRGEKNIKSANIKLLNDIKVNLEEITKNSQNVKKWIPIGSEESNFLGTFDGNGHSISGLYLNEPEGKNIGLFGYVGPEGSVSNVIIKNSYFCGRQYVGGIVGYNRGTVRKCVNLGIVEGLGAIGGNVGMNEGNSVKRCKNSGRVKGRWERIGGNVGHTLGAIGSCINSGEIIGKRKVGGNVGIIIMNGVAGCENFGKVEGEEEIGGNIGFNSTISEHCKNSGEITGDKYVGGNVGINRSIIRESENSGKVTVNYIGGGNIGWNYGEKYGAHVIKCKNSGEIIGGKVIGGVVGVNEGDTDENDNIDGAIILVYNDKEDDEEKDIINVIINTEESENNILGEEGYIENFLGKETNKEGHILLKAKNKKGHIVTIELNNNKDRADVSVFDEKSQLNKAVNNIKSVVINEKGYFVDLFGEYNYYGGLIKDCINEGIVKGEGAGKIVSYNGGSSVVNKCIHTFRENL